MTDSDDDRTLLYLRGLLSFTHPVRQIEVCTQDEQDARWTRRAVDVVVPRLNCSEDVYRHFGQLSMPGDRSIRV